MPLDQMVGHDHPRSIVGAPLRHVAGDAIGGGGVLSGRDKRFDGCDRALPCGMALSADGGIVVHRFRAARHAMWIVTSLTSQRAFALRKAFGLTQPVDGTHRLEFVVVSVPGA